MSSKRTIKTIIRVSLIASSLLLCTDLIANAQGGRATSSKSSFSSSSISSASQECDRDRDGAIASSPTCGGKDCNDSDADINPSRLEISIQACQDGKDNDCNGSTDCADQNCRGKPAFLPDSLTYKTTGMCCFTPEGGKVVDVTSDSKNCGTCENKCKDGEMCVEGHCLNRCTAATTTCFKEPIPFEMPINRDSAGKYPQPIQSVIDRYLGDPDCPRPTKDPRFDVKYFSEPLLDGRGKPTGQTIRGLCLTVNF